MQWEILTDSSSPILCLLLHLKCVDTSTDQLLTVDNSK